jgi:hypothetical protein
MQKICLLSLAVAGVLSVPDVSRAQYAGVVTSYSQGSGVLSGYNNSGAALGAPTTSFVDPFDPPWQSSDIVGVGTGGSLTLQFNSPVLNNAANPFGLDFIVFGHAGFDITNNNYSGGGITDGTLFTGGTSQVRVSVSADGANFYTLDPTKTPIVDGLFPTDGSGNPFLPVNPALTAGDFAGKDLTGIRQLYAGSAGGAGFDLAWALDDNNQSVALASVDYVRLEVLSGVAYIDAVSAVPEPATGMLLLAGPVLVYLRRRIR